MARGTITGLLIACALPVAAQQSPDTPREPATTAPEAPVESDTASDHTHEDQDEHRLRYYDDVEVTVRSDDLVGIAGSSNEGSTGRDARHVA